jgi:nitrous-oxide reductase
MKWLRHSPIAVLLISIIGGTSMGCKPGQVKDIIEGDAAARVYVPPGKYDEMYMFTPGGFSGQVSVYGLPSGRLLKVIPVFSQNPENGYGYSGNDPGLVLLMSR